MKLLFDQNISFRILKLLPDILKDSRHVKTEGLTNCSDYEIWEYSKINGFTIVTQDSDFNDISIINGFPPKIIWLKTGNLKTNDILNLLLFYSVSISAFLEDNTLGCFEIFKYS